jgi:6-phosphogluconolactonase
MSPASDVRICADAPELARRVAEVTAAILTGAVRATGRGSLVLSGGNTPRALYAQWASGFAREVPWAGVHVFWGDERFVPPGDPRSNFKLAKETLLDLVPCPAANIHPMSTMAATPESAAASYETTLREYFADGRTRFDVVLLGLGPDGHTASLFPKSPALDEQVRWVVPVSAPVDPPSRLTLTLPALNRAAHVFFLVTGSEKAAVLERVLDGSLDRRQYPAAGVRPDGELVWWVDREAAARYQTGTRP